ncbi:helix-turn-helix domain-containing protein [Pseudoalteromonas denitrificans]|uniref:Helix-turn-helix domain-containing protein n=1 Tax=Pseudoalteromonas denitrificans DSM 6059 TaxID=1123010 RepID=A0A1I1GCM8_9GAMM|nr:helix-turn-helix domain-containing protein [Pseudoalteromonas denitrificans]SFC06880.1 Helix-turn-helix domain-containing protein [Pseudoalteromonas denitrificans DSM 6059]
MAASGKLNKHQATSTWWLADYLQKKFTEIEWLFSQSYISDTNIDTASGVNGYLQIAQSLIKKMHSESVLREIQDLMVLAKPEPQVQPFKIINIMKIDNDLIRKIYLWVENTAARDIGIELLAQYLNMTSRTLSRKVKILTDLSCSQFLRIVKMHQASEYLIHSTQGVSAISNMLGFSDDVSFRRSFKNITQYTPSKYRQLFKR